MAVVNGLNISDNLNYITQEITFRSMPIRDVQSQPISRASGDKLTATEWKRKEIIIKGVVFDTTAELLRTRVDTMQQNFAVQSLALSIDTDRIYTATLTSLDIPTQFYNNTYVNYEAHFIAVDPFAYGTQITASGTTVSGQLTVSGTLTISGTVYAQPTLSIYPKGANVGNSGLAGIQFTYTPTGETITVSGVFNYNAGVVIDFKNFLVTNSGIASDYTGIFSRFDPGSINYTLTVISGVRQAYNYVWGYQPRYYE